MSGDALVLDLDARLNTSEGIRPVRDLVGRSITVNQADGSTATVAIEAIEPQASINVRTKRGYTLDVPAGLANKLLQLGGQPIIFSPAEKSQAEMGQRFGAWWDGYVTALVAFSGFYSGDQAKPARVVVWGYENAASKLLIRRLYHLRELAKITGTAWKITKDDEQRVSTISSRLIDRAIEKYLEPKTLLPKFDLRTVDVEFRHGFLTGALSIGRMGPSGIRVEHRSRQVVDTVHEVLLMSFGIRSNRAHQPHAADFVETKGNRGPDTVILHRLTVERDQFMAIAARKLAKRDDLTPTGVILEFEDFADEIAAITPAEEERACARVTGADKLAVNGFLVGQA